MYLPWLLLCYGVLTPFTLCMGANILAVFPFQGKSHWVVYEPLLIGLADKGHDVDVLSHFPLNEPVPGYNDMSLQGTLPYLINNISIDALGNGLVRDFHFIMTVTGTDVCNVIFNTSLAQDLKNSGKKYDLLITEIFATDCMLGFAHIFNVPSIGLTSSVNLPWTSDRLGIPDNPSYIPNYFAPHLPTMTLKERLVNTLMTIGTKIAYNVLSLEPANSLAKNFFGQDLPNLYELVNKMSLVFVNSHFSIHQSRPLVPNLIEIGGIHIGQNKSLNEQFTNSLRTHLKGVIYLSFGSMLRTESMVESKLRAMFEAFEQLPYKVIWKAGREDFPKHIAIPKNIEFHKWMPQLDILCHPNVKLFVSHGGLLGTQEAIYCGVPVLGIPMFADQELNIKTCAASGLALEVPYSSITKDLILSTAQELLENPKYKQNCAYKSRLFRDRPMSPLETAIYWVEYVIRYNGAPHLRSVGADLAWYQYYLVDVAAIVLSGFILLSVSIYYTILFLLSLFRNKNVGKVKTS